MMHPEDWVRERANEPLSRHEQYSRDVTCIPEGVDLSLIHICVPSIMPVSGLIVKPAGKPVALYSRGISVASTWNGAIACLLYTSLRALGSCTTCAAAGR